MNRRSVPLLSLLLVLAACQGGRPIKLDLRDFWDETRVLANPDKGWYHHLLDNGVDNYRIEDESVVDRFPGLDHFYLRIAWSYLEPEEGKYDWTLIDQVVDRYVPRGFGISFRITSKETGAAPGAVSSEVDGVMYATPSWVREAGAGGVIAEQWGTRSWTPDWDDPIYLEKLDSFHRAFAERYDGKPWVRYIDVGSIGEWGEGHTHFSTQVPPTAGEVKANIDAFLRNYKQTQLVATDDLLYYGKPEDVVGELLRYAVENGLTLRDDSPLVGWYVENNLETWSVSHPQFYDPLYLQKPVILEAEHYRMVKENGFWMGRDGAEPIAGKGVGGADVLRGAIRTLHATYIGFHGRMEEWLEENPGLARELANLCGYWYFPVQVTLPERIAPGEEATVEMVWMNKGVAPAYRTYAVEFRFVKPETGEGFEITLEDSGNRKWLPGQAATASYTLPIPESALWGRHDLMVRLTNPPLEQTVEIGLEQGRRDSKGFYRIASIQID